MRHRALVVDDNPNNLMLVKDLLEAADFEVLEAETGTQGLVLARTEKLDILILDVRLPDLRGSEVAKQLRLSKETRDIPIVFVTASVMPEGRDEIKTIANTAFIGKPINTRTFAKEILSFIR